MIYSSDLARSHQRRAGLTLRDGSICAAAQFSHVPYNNSHSAAPGEPGHPSWLMAYPVQSRDQTIRKRSAVECRRHRGSQPNVDPRTGTFAWGVETRKEQCFQARSPRLVIRRERKLHGTIHLSETLTLGNDGQTHKRDFHPGFLDPSGNSYSKFPATSLQNAFRWIDQD